MVLAYPANLSVYTVTTLPALSAGEAGAVVYCADAAWSGGTGCLATWSGTAWKDPNGRTATTTAYSPPGASAGGLDRQVQFNNAGSLDGAPNVNLDSNGNLHFDSITSFSNNPATGASLYVRELAGFGQLTVQSAIGRERQVQSFLGTNDIARWLAAGNGTAISAEGGPALTAVGTATTANIGIANKQQRTKRVEYLVTTAATTAIAGYRVGSSQYWRSSVAGENGFFYVSRFSGATGRTNALHRSFTGVSNATAAPTDVNPSTLINILGVGYDSADTEWQIMHNNATGAATKIPLGASFPKPNTDRTNMFELALFAPPQSALVYYEFTDLTSLAVARGTINSPDIPPNDQLLSARGWNSVGGVSSVVGYTFSSLHMGIFTNR